MLCSISNREVAISGGVAMATAFATYLGPYSFAFRREMLTVHWPKCLEERGVPLVLDTTGGPFRNAHEFNRNELKKRVSSGLEENSGSLEDSDTTDENANYERNGEEKQEQQMTYEADNEDESKDGTTDSPLEEPKVGCLLHSSFYCFTFWQILVLNPLLSYMI